MLAPHGVCFVSACTAKPVNPDFVAFHLCCICMVPVNHHRHQRRRSRTPILAYNRMLRMYDPGSIPYYTDSC